VSAPWLNPDELAAAVKARGNWSNTAGGNVMFPMDPRPEDIHLDDIAQALGRICRFNGHLRRDVELYTVAQHSVIVSHACPPNLALIGLLHDAHEAFLGDVTTPVKSLLSDAYRVAERRHQWAIATAFDVDVMLLWDMPPEIKTADLAALATERRDLVEHKNRPWGAMPDPLPERIVPLRPFDAIELFLGRFNELVNQRHPRSFVP